MTRKEKQRAYDRARYRANPEKKRAAVRAYVAANRAVHNARVVRYQKQHPEKVKAWRLAKYGLTLEQYTALLTAQQHRCGICGEPLVSPRIDHDHVTGRVRGILCNACNAGLGLLGDTVDGVQRALSYLERVRP